MIFGLPGWVILPLPFTLFNWASFWGWLPLMITFGTALWLRKKGRTLTWMARRIKTNLRGKKIVARSIGYRRVQSTELAPWNFDFEKWREL